MVSKQTSRAFLSSFFRRYPLALRGQRACFANLHRQSQWMRRSLSIHCGSKHSCCDLQRSNRCAKYRQNSSLLTASASGFANSPPSIPWRKTRNALPSLAARPSRPQSTAIQRDSLPPIRWRFRENGPVGRNEETRVLLAGPHFHAAIPSLRAEIDRRKTQKNDSTSTEGMRFDNIRLIHAPTKDELWKSAASADVAIPFMEAFPKDFFDPSVTPRLRLVVQFGVGLEGVDVNEATQRGIAVSNVPAAGTGNAQATAEHALYLAIALLRGVVTRDFASRFSDRSLGGLPIPRTLYQKRVTVVGYGAVGSCLAKYLAVLGARVTVLRRRPWEPETPGNPSQDSVFPAIHKANSLEKALPNTDVLFLACTLTPDTHSLLRASTIDLLPRGALVVNVARGALVEHGAMLRALQSGRVGGFASDVGIGHPTKPSEPWDPDDEICHLGPNANVLFTPHVGGYSDASYEVMVRKIVDAIEHTAAGKAPPVWVNREE